MATTTGTFNFWDAAIRRVTLRAVLLRLALLCLVVCCAAGAFWAVVDAAKLLPNQYDNTYPESSDLYAAVQGARTGHIYLPLYSPPYVVQPYGPLFYIVNLAIARAAHFSLDLARLEIRCLTYICFLLCGLLAYGIVRKMKPPAWTAILSALALLAQPYFLDWNATVRPDLPCLLLMLLCLFFAVGSDLPPVRACCLSGFFGGLAFLVKQPGLAAPAAVFAVLLLRREFRAALTVVLSAALPVAVVFGVLLLRREPFLDQFASVGKNLWSLSSGARFLKDTADLRIAVSFCIAAIALPRALRAGRSSQILAVFLFAGMAMGLAGMPQVGADVNYYLPPLAACALLLPFCIEEFQKRAGHPLVLAIAIVVLLASFNVAAANEKRVRSQSQPPRLSHPYEALSAFHILSDRPVFTVHGRDPELLDPFTMHGLEAAGHWDSAPIVGELRQSVYDLIFLSCSGVSRVVCNFRGLSYFSPAVVQAVNENYVVFCSTLSARVLAPRDRKIDATPAMLAPALGQPCGIGAQGKPANLIFPPSLQ